MKEETKEKLGYVGSYLRYINTMVKKMDQDDTLTVQEIAGLIMLAGSVKESHDRLLELTRHNEGLVYINLEEQTPKEPVKSKDQWWVPEKPKKPISNLTLFNPDA